MRLISYEKDGSTGVGIMRDDTNFVSLSAAAPTLPTSMIGLLNHEGGFWRRPKLRLLGKMQISPLLMSPFCQ